MTRSGVIDEFERSLTARQSGVTKVESAEATGEIDRIVEQPAVGTPLPFDGVSLTDSTVTVDPSPNELEPALTGVTAATLAIADYGTVVLTSGTENTEGASVFPETHVAVLAASDVVADMPTAFDRLGTAFDGGLTSAVLASGPSATADMGALVYGAHGPRAVHVVILTDL